MRLCSILSMLGILVSTSALAQTTELFGSGKPLIFKDTDLDQRFARSRLRRSLTQGSQNPHCMQLLGGLLTALGETAPLLHKRDENFYLDAHLAQALTTQLSTTSFPAPTFLSAMVRRVLIDGRLPPAWLQTAQKLRLRGAPIDLGKLRLLATGVDPIDSFYFTLPALVQRYEQEVGKATSDARKEAMTRFRDRYLDRQVAWSGLTLVDIRSDGSKGKKEAPVRLAILEWKEAEEEPDVLPLFEQKKPEPLRITARLSPEQLTDLDVARGSRVMVRGRLWELDENVRKLEIRDAQLFSDRDWSKGVELGSPEAIASCPVAVNDLDAKGPSQPGGFGHRL